MTNFRVNFSRLAGLSMWLPVVLAAQAVYGQSGTAGQPGDDGISSYIFSPRAVTVLLVLVLIAQLVYRHRVRNATRTAPATYSPPEDQQASQAVKKRYDRDELSKLLKASATSKNNGRSLEEAIRMSQAAQATLIGSLVGHGVEKQNDATVVDSELQAFDVEPHALELDPQANESEPQAAEVEPQAAEVEPRAVELNSQAVEDAAQVIEPETAD